MEKEKKHATSRPHHGDACIDQLEKKRIMTIIDWTLIKSDIALVLQT
jgi:hypothetical protein